MKNEVGNLQVGKNDLPEKPGEIETDAEQIAGPVSRPGAREEEIMAEMSHQQAGKDPQCQVKGVEHPGKKDPEGEHDQKGGNLGHHRISPDKPDNNGMERLPWKAPTTGSLTGPRSSFPCKKSTGADAGRIKRCPLLT
jgi:hypothetical protein